MIWRRRRIGDGFGDGDELATVGDGDELATVLETVSVWRRFGDDLERKTVSETNLRRRRIGDGFGDGVGGGDG